MKVVVAMSGGVDSSVAAALLKEQGHEVIGITMQLQPSDRLAEKIGRSGDHYSLDAVADAEKVAQRLGIPHHVVDFRDVFARDVIADFCREYSLGRTPNPCIRCNRYIKFGALLKRAQELGAEMIATGHYARIEKDTSSGRYLLKKGNDHRKDQTYVLCMLTQEQLGHSLFPVGNLTKQEVRHAAEKLGLPFSDKAESQEICFIPDNEYARFLAKYTAAATRPGTIIDRRGNVLGEHRGIIHYTIGQRKGLGIASREPLYVTAIDPEKNTITIGGKSEVYATGLIASNLNWISIEEPDGPMNVKARIRYRHREADATVTPMGTNEVVVKFREPQMAITPGQAVVFYDGEIVVGGGTIARVGSTKGIKQ
jgi:tRNA-specific 2-thiouridylase